MFINGVIPKSSRRRISVSVGTASFPFLARYRASLPRLAHLPVALVGFVAASNLALLTNSSPFLHLCWPPDCGRRRDRVWKNPSAAQRGWAVRRRAGPRRCSSRCRDAPLVSEKCSCRCNFLDGHRPAGLMSSGILITALAMCGFSVFSDCLDVGSRCSLCRMIACA